MPIYEYIDANDHTQTVTHRMLFSTGILCAACGLPMHRKPQPFMVSWGGLKPSQGEMSPAVRGLLATADERRETGADYVDYR